MIREATIDDIKYVVGHLRDVDAAEQFATRFPGDDTPAALAADLVSLRSRAIQSFAFCFSAQPACILSAYLLAPGVAKLHRISTDGWLDVASTVFRFGIREFMPAIATTAHRMECAILSDHDIAGEMLRRLGFECEGVARKRGRHGEDFTNFAWVKP